MTATPFLAAATAEWTASIRRCSAIVAGGGRVGSPSFHTTVVNVTSQRRQSPAARSRNWRGSNDQQRISDGVALDAVEQVIPDQLRRGRDRPLSSVVVG